MFFSLPEFPDLFDFFWEDQFDGQHKVRFFFRGPIHSTGSESSAKGAFLVEWGGGGPVQMRMRQGSYEFSFQNAGPALG